MLVSVVIPSRNEEKIVTKNLMMISSYLKKCNAIEDYEIIVCDRSEDNTPLYVKELALKDTKIKFYHVEEKGLGAGLKVGMDKTSFEFIIFYDIDMAWKLNFIEESINEIQKGYDIVYGSRSNKKANVLRPIKRQIFSYGYRFFIKCLFHDVQINDWNANRIFRKSSIMPFRNKLISNSGFIHTEMVVYAKKYHLKMKEIPAIVHDPRNDSLSYIIKITLSVFISALKLRIRL